jgi:hypothetical protein
MTTHEGYGMRENIRIFTFGKLMFVNKGAAAYVVLNYHVMKVSGISNLWVFVFSYFYLSVFNFLQTVRLLETYDLFSEVTHSVDGRISDNPLICSETMQPTWLIFFVLHFFYI